MIMVSTVVAHADPASDKQANGQRRQQVEQELNLATASNAALEAEVNRLDAAAAAEQAKLADLRQAESAANAASQAAAQKVAELQGRSDAARAQLAQRAVDAYTSPSKAGGFFAMTQAKSFDEAAQRQTIVDLVQGRTVDAIGELRAAKEDEAAAHVELTRAQAVAADRTKAQSAQVATAVSAQSGAQAAEAAMKARIATLTQESQQLATQDAAIQALIQAQEQADAQAQAAAQAAPAASAPPAAAQAGPGAASPASTAAPAKGAAAAKPSAAGFIWPISGPVTSEYGPRWGGFHPGIDIAGPNGGAIVAARSGTVIYAQFNDGGYGNLVVIDNGGVYATAYAHQSKIAVSVGQTVNQGQVIGYEGSTGFSTGPHLHFEVRVNGTAQNPRDYVSGQP
ncbi:MAG: M23 family metallopeptidase [Actinomycetota bacterium]|nr:M23 family metallopeptidase [Actinomycetota bacterium]